MSDDIQLLTFAASLGLGILLALWLASSASNSAKTRIVERLAISILYLGTASALLVVALAVVRRSAEFPALAPIIAAFFMDGIVLGTAVTSPGVFTGVFKSQHDLRDVIFSPSVVRANRYLTASYFLMVGLFKWITDAEYSFFQASGYNRTFYIFICAFECLCAVGLLLRITVLPVVLALSVEMVGAVYTHVHNYFAKGLPDPFGNSLDAFRMLILLAYIAVAALQQNAPVLSGKPRYTGEAF